MQLERKVALVTGASSGIGEAAARKLAQEGAHVGVLGRTPEDTEKVTKDIQAAGGKATTLLADVSEPDELQKAIKQLGDAQGKIDIVVANAGINGTWASLDDLTVDDYEQTMGINFRGTFLTVKYALPYLRNAGGGAIAVVASVNGSRMFSNTGATLYASSKAAQVAFTKMTAIELAKDKVRINVICPGAIETEIDDNTDRVDLSKISYPVEFPEGKVPLTGGEPGKASQVADLIFFLTSDMSSHISGTEVWIDGAQSLLQG
jgi:NAD(P)-dependent dehydrogenase (short-subunit alcohol dehydrogenase family)